MEYKNLIFAKHGESKSFLFELPLGEKIYKMHGIVVDTMYGRKSATATTDSFIVPSEIADLIAEGCGAYLPLKRVVGTVILKEVCKQFDETELPF
jgi:hypothetical protein